MVKCTELKITNDIAFNANSIYGKIYFDRSNKNISKRYHCTWWRHQMETFSALLAICAGNSPVTGESPAQMPVTRSLHVFFHLRLNKQLSKQSWGWWLAVLSRPLWRYCNEMNNHRPSAGRVLAAQIRHVLFKVFLAIIIAFYPMLSRWCHWIRQPKSRGTCSVNTNRGIPTASYLILHEYTTIKLLRSNMWDDMST